MMAAAVLWLLQLAGPAHRGLAEQGHMAYRTVHVYPQANAQINKAIEMIASGQATPEEAWRQAQENAIADIRRAGVDL